MPLASKPVGYKPTVLPLVAIPNQGDDLAWWHHQFNVQPCVDDLLDRP